MEIKQLENNDRKALAIQFKGVKANDKMVADFCTRHKIPLTDAGSVEDFIYQQEYDDRLNVVLPLVLKALAKLQYAGEYISKLKRKEIGDANDEISREIAQILEDNGILYREVSLLQSLAGDVAQLFATAERRVSNMCATVLAEMAVEKLGDPLSIKLLAGERAMIADRKAKRQGLEKSNIVGNEIREKQEK